jgi:S-adenosylmethionine:tRNA ribosyltransferase-isomerase
MRTELLDYTLPEELIAQTPADKRRASRLLVLGRSDGALSDHWFSELPQFLRSGDCLVLNNTKVLPARFYAQKPTGAKLEGLFVTQSGDTCWQVLLKNARKIKPGDPLILLDHTQKPAFEAVAVERLSEGLWHLRVKTDLSPEAVLLQIGFAPLPPYIKRAPDSPIVEEDLQRYQTIYAKQPGAVAAPTAGLHFDTSLLEQITAKGIKLAYITLHVGIGTFRPVQTETLDEHPMHEEYYQIDAEAAATINTAAQSGGRIIAVGTTSVRTLESAAQGRSVSPTSGRTRLFIKPGYRFNVVDAMVTNFHLPKSTLLALVGAFAGLDSIMAAYRHAIEQKYRFYSYGDAMFIA